MAKVLRVLLVLAVVLAVIGYFRSWYAVSQINEETTTSIILKIDRQRVREDLQLARKRVDEMQQKIGEEEDPDATREESASQAIPPSGTR